jgi:hypothetical protein
MRLFTSAIATAIAALAASCVSASAQTPVPVGVLACQGGQNVGFVVGSVAQFECVFRSAGRRPEGYTATIRRFGVDLGFTEQTQLSWTVSAPSMRLPPGALAGTYGGVGANASVGIGFGGNFLVGGPGNAFGLQPISVQGQTGLNVAAGVADIDLQPVGFAPRRGYRHGRHHHAYPHHHHHYRR